MVVLQRHTQPEYKRWVKLLKGLYMVKDVLCPYVEQVLDDFHAAALRGKLGDFCCSAPTLQLAFSKKTKKWSITGIPACTGNNRCADWLDTIGAVHLKENRKDLFEPFDLAQLNTSSWEVGKTFLTKAQAADTNAPADLDPYYLTKMITHCILFSSQSPHDIHDAVEKVLKTRNGLAHAAAQGIKTDAEVNEKIDEMIALVKLLPNAPPNTTSDLEKVRDGNIAEVDEEMSQREADIFRMFLQEAQQGSAEQLDRIQKEVLLFVKKHEDIWQRIQSRDKCLAEWGQMLVDLLGKGNAACLGEIRALNEKIDELMRDRGKTTATDIIPDGGNTLECLQCELVDTYKEHFKNLQPVPWVDVKLDINLVYQEQTLEGREDMWRQHDRASEVKDIFLPLSKGEARPKLILVEGAPGMGKTTLCQRLLQDWVQCIQPSQCGSDDSGQHLKDFQLVVFLRERYVTSSDLWLNLQENLLSDRWDDKENLAGCLRNIKEQVLFLIDGYDEGSESQKRWTDGWLKGREMRGATIIITSRPGFCKPQPPPDRMYTLKGFDEQMQTKFIKEFNSLMRAKEMGETSISDLLTPFQGQDILQIPIFLTILCFLARQGLDVLPKSTTNLYKEFVKFMSHKALDEPAKFSKNYVSKLQMWLQEIAFLLFEFGKSEITLEVLAKHVSDSQVKETMDNFCKLGLVCQEIKLKGTDTFQAGTFIHQSFKDYFSALHFFSLQRKERSRFIENTEIHHNVFVFVAGLCEAGGHKELFTQLVSAWKQEVEAKVKLPAFDGSDSVENDMDLMYWQTGDLHSLLHAPLLWLNQLSDPAWLSADNMAAITQTTKAIHLTPDCLATCSRGLLGLIKAFKDVHPSSVSLTSGTPLHIAMYALHLDGNTQVELMHHTLQSRDSVRCVQLSLPAYTPEACARLADLVPDITHLVYLAIFISSWESLDIVSRGFQPSSPLRRIAVYCTPSSSSDTLTAAQPVWSPSTDFIPAIKCLDQLRCLQMGDKASILSHDIRRNIHCLISSEMPKVSLEIYDWDPDINQYKTDTSCLPDRQTNS